ncbi:MAG: MarR family winged helix-turn-helix transcriptional regulator [Myxococcota bacterium]|nr:MarR family winged helix-turn-helix transcriptional regulator [Myxococcota bacterium]
MPTDTLTTAPYGSERDPPAIPEPFPAPRIGFEPGGRGFESLPACQNSPWIPSFRARSPTSSRAHGAGAATFVQRFGDALNRNVHFRSLVLDGVYARSAEGTRRFHSLPPPDDVEVKRAARQVARRLTRRLERRRLGDATPESDTLAAVEPLLASLDAASVTSRVATGPRTGQRVLRIGDRIDADDLPVLRGERSASVGGGSVHANVAVPARDRRLVEKLAALGPSPRLLLLPWVHSPAPVAMTPSMAPTGIPPFPPTHPPESVVTVNRIDIRSRAWNSGGVASSAGTLVWEIADRIGHAHALLTLALAEVIGPTPLTVGEAIGLMVLSLTPEGRTQVEWSHALGVTRQHAHALARRLVALRLVRGERRGRTVLMRVTPRGIALIEAVRPAAEARLVRALSALSASERSALHRLGGRLVEALERDAAGGA